MDAGTTTASTLSSEEIALVDTFVSKLGVSQQQALDGAGFIFQLAQGNLDPQAFTTLSQSVPSMNKYAKCSNCHAEICYQFNRWPVFIIG